MCSERALKVLADLKKQHSAADAVQKAAKKASAAQAKLDRKKAKNRSVW